MLWQMVPENEAKTEQNCVKQSPQETTQPFFAKSRLRREPLSEYDMKKGVLSFVANKAFLPNEKRRFSRLCIPTGNLSPSNLSGPTARQVLFLQKCGMLFFAPATPRKFTCCQALAQPVRAPRYRIWSFASWRRTRGLSRPVTSYSTTDRRARLADRRHAGSIARPGLHAVP
jgi:hypothetical protein